MLILCPPQKQQRANPPSLSLLSLPSTASPSFRRRRSHGHGVLVVVPVPVPTPEGEFRWMKMVRSGGDWEEGICGGIDWLFDLEIVPDGNCLCPWMKSFAFVQELHLFSHFLC
ncbi:hypothetical protein MLD38_009615 [Melastoma candidum]|uniref:Uncharacterized protein n=1 Tax=Melastoma candidum TaxID=119954 RepID=A0ACB9RXR8_9MYRT|nr:hypothetical protein MLD38_009615 [Melastoma candidum]